MIPFIETIIISILVNIITYWIFLFIMKYICSTHIELNRRNMCLCTIVAAVSFYLISITESDILELCSMPLLVSLTILLFSSRRFKDLYCLYLLYQLANPVFFTDSISHIHIQ